MLQAALSAVTQKAWLSLGKSEGEKLCPCAEFRDSQIQIQKASKTPKVDEKLGKKRPNKPEHIGLRVTSLKRGHVMCLGVAQDLLVVVGEGGQPALHPSRTSESTTRFWALFQPWQSVIDQI